VREALRTSNSTASYSRLGSLVGVRLAIGVKFTAERRARARNLALRQASAIIQRKEFWILALSGVVGSKAGWACSRYPC